MMWGELDYSKIAPVMRDLEMRILASALSKADIFAAAYGGLIRRGPREDTLSRTDELRFAIGVMSPLISSLGLRVDPDRLKDVQRAIGYGLSEDRSIINIIDHRVRRPPDFYDAHKPDLGDPGYIKQIRFDESHSFAIGIIQDAIQEYGWLRRLLDDARRKFEETPREDRKSYDFVAAAMDILRSREMRDSYLYHRPRMEIMREDFLRMVPERRSFPGLVIDESHLVRMPVFTNPIKVEPNLDHYHTDKKNPLAKFQPGPKNATPRAKRRNSGK